MNDRIFPKHHFNIFLNPVLHPTRSCLVKDALRAQKVALRSKRVAYQTVRWFRVRFFKKIQDWILKSERIRKWILRFFTKQINPRSSGSWRVKGTEESTSRVESSVPLTHHDPRYLGLICLVKKRKIHFQILSDLRIQSWIFLKKRTLTFLELFSSMLQNF